MSLRRCVVTDLSTLDLRGAASQRKRTDEGFLQAPAAIATADNVQTYRARELGITDGDSSRLLRLFRPRSEVFSADTLASFEGKTLTVSHPAAGVDAVNWKRVTAGDVSDIKASGAQMLSVILVKDAGAIDVVEKDGVVQLSCGYDFDLDLTPGTAPDGSAYDGIQRNIRGNHVAIVDSARGGPALRIADRNPDPTKEIPMALRKVRMADVALAGVTIPGFTVSVEDSAADAAEEARDRHVAELTKAITAADATSAKLVLETKRADDAVAKVTELTTAKAIADAKIVELTKAADPARIEALAVERSAVVADAAILAPEFKADGKTVAAIRTEVLAEVIAKDEALKAIAVKALGDHAADLPKAPEAVVSVVFSALAGMAKAARGNDASAGDNDDTRDRDRALAGNNGGSHSSQRGAGKAPRFLGMDAVNEADRLHHLGKHAEADTVLSEARQ